MSEVRGGGRECQAATAQEQPRGATARPRSGAAAERRYPASEGRGGGREELHTPKVRGSSREEQPHIQGAVAARVPEGLEELLHVQCQEGWQ